MREISVDKGMKCAASSRVLAAGESYALAVAISLSTSTTTTTTTTPWGVCGL